MTVARVDDRVERPFARCIRVDARRAARIIFIELDAPELVSREEKQPGST